MYHNIFDTHTHYNDEMFSADRKNVLAALEAAGICCVINCATNVASSKECLEMAQAYPFVYAACGIHPEDCADTGNSDFAEIAQLLQQGKCVAVGEIGLDYHYDFVPKEKQLDVFEKQLALAKELDLPVIIHDREAHGDTLTLLRKYRPKGVLHCFSGSTEMAKEVVSLGMYIGLGGAVTFKNAVKPVEVASFVPDDRLLIETDCPYMSPVPYRGKRNDSTHLIEIGEFIAGLRNTTPQNIFDITSENAKTLFSI